ncbi:hypothetical protein HanIR_Chr14g0707191 [Helianthus annuus]|nr:hypothetical protein HanIR_Chr14g0707191 [Helianthus annuus]
MVAEMWEKVEELRRRRWRSCDGGNLEAGGERLEAGEGGGAVVAPEKVVEKSWGGDMFEDL